MMQADNIQNIQNIQKFDYNTRSHWINEHRAQVKKYDAVILGGGIVGAGLARELALRGKSCLLAEKNDFASGTSSKSSKLIHGGLRYLEMGDFYLVFESLAERHWLIDTHPHLVKPIEFNIPIYQKKKAPRGAKSTALVGIGLWLYDLLSLFRTPFFHGKHSRSETISLFPGIKKEGLKGSYYYPDAMMLDDELVLEILFDTVKRGGVALNYTEVTHVGEKESDGTYTVTLKDSVATGEPFKVKADEVIVCAGPWTEIAGAEVEGGAVKKLKPSKGVHLIVPFEKFPIEHCFVMGIEDGRIMFGIPRKDFGEGAEVTIIGTTDSPEVADPSLAKTVASDVDYLLKVVEHYFPDRRITPNDIIQTYAGVRPLIDSGESSEATTSREHEIWRNTNGVVFMAGGKYTTFRRISEEIADFAFPKSKGNAKASKQPISTPADYQKRLLGTKIWGQYTDEWVRWKCAHQAPLTLADIVFRRMPLWMAGTKITPQALEKIAAIAGDYFNWSKDKISEELNSCNQLLKAGLDWKN